MRFHLFLITFLFIGCTVSGRDLQDTEHSQRTFIQPACMDKSRAGSFIVSSSVEIAKKFIPEDKDKTVIFKNAIEQQLRYLVAHEFHEAYANQSVPDFTATSNNADITITSVESKKYFAGFKISSINHPDVTIEDPYMRMAIKSGSVAETEDSFEVTYQAKLKGVGCLLNGNIKKQTSLPRDPYLAYWYYPESKFPLIRWRQSSFRTNPCSDEELADIPHPYYFWYFWEPSKKNTRRQSKSNECLSVYNSKTLINAEISFEEDPSHPIAQGAGRIATLKMKDEIKAAYIFGIIDSKGTQPTTKSLIEMLTDSSADLNQAFASLSINLNENDTKLERGALYFGRFLSQLTKILNIRSTTYEEIPHGIVLNIHGDFRKSGKKISLNVFYGPTDVLDGFPPAHWSFLADAIKQDDVLVYNGHSGLGENVSLKNITSNSTGLSILKGDGIPEYQLIAILSCYSSYYYNSEISQLRKKVNTNAVTDTVLTGSSYTSDIGALGILAYIDSILDQGQSDPAFLYRNSFISPVDNWITQQ